MPLRGRRSRRRASKTSLGRLADDNLHLRTLLRVKDDQIDHLRYNLAAADRQAEAQRAMIAKLGRLLHQAQAGPLGDTVPMPRVRSAGPVVHDHGADLIAPWPPKEWTQ